MHRPSELYIPVAVLILLTAYGLVSVITCALVMRGQGLDWGAIAVIVLGPLALIPAAGWVQRAQKTR